MRFRNLTFRPIPLFAACLLVAGLATHGAAQDDDGHDQRRAVTGIVDQIQLIDASSMGGGRELILHLETGEAFRFPHADHVAASAGVKLIIRYREASADGELPVACNAEVLALPLGDDSDSPGGPGNSLQPASQPFEVYRNPDC